MWVDLDRLEVVALGLQENVLSKVIASNEKVMLLNDIRQMGDVLLVDDDTVLDGDINTATLSSLINSEVITESGEVLGRVRGFKFDVITGKLETVVVASLGLPQIPDQVLSTYELPVEEIVSTGPDRIIVFEGSEEKLIQISVGLLERLGLGTSLRERGLGDNYSMPTSASNQLPSGIRTEVQRARPAAEERRRAAPPPQREPAREAQRPPREKVLDLSPEDVDVEGDVWGEPAKQEEFVEAKQPLIIPKKKVMEYEEETDY
jgi:sporulation protein YlmC with PRC-barrel domain